MTTPTPPYMPGQSSQPTAPAPAVKSRLPLILGTLAAVFLALTAGILIAAAWFLGLGDKPAAHAQPVASAGPQYGLPSAQDETLPDPEPTTAGPPLNKADLKLSLKTVDKQCFGSAGCNLDVKVQATMLTAFASPETWEVTYEISGDDSGPIVGSFELTDGKYDVNEETLSTKSSKTKVAVKVVSVEKVGY